MFKRLFLRFQGYMTYLAENEVSDEMREKCKIVFGNIHQIFEWHKETFSEELQRCVEDPDRLAGLFLRLVGGLVALVTWDGLP